MNASFKPLTLLLIIAMATSSVLLIESASAQSTPKPSVPEFTVQLTDHSYDVPTSYSTDEYTGKTITHEGYHVENKTLDVIIKNQQFGQYTDNSGNTTSLYYKIREKGHFGDNWKYYPTSDSYKASGTAYTTISFFTSYTPYQESNTIYAPTDSQIDFQVQAQIGYYHTEWVSMDTSGQHPLLGGLVPIFYGQTGDWSNIHTFNISDSTLSVSPLETPATTPESTASETPNPPSPSIPEFSILTILPFFAVLPLIMIALLRKKKTASI
jgi:hypothetical protein